MELTNHDKKYLYFINRHVVIDIDILMIEFEVKKITIYKKCELLKKKGLIIFEKLPFSSKRNIFLTKKGHRLLGTDLTHKTKTKISDYEHDKNVIDILQHYQMMGFKYVTEREFRSTFSKKYFLSGSRFSVPDGVIFLNGKFISLELEWTRKGEQEITDKLIDYESNDFFDGVLYVCRDETIGKLKQVISNLNLERPQIINFCSYRTYKLEDLF